MLGVAPRSATPRTLTPRDASPTGHSRPCATIPAETIQYVRIAEKQKYILFLQERVERIHDENLRLINHIKSISH